MLFLLFSINLVLLMVLLKMVGLAGYTGCDPESGHKLSNTLDFVALRSPVDENFRLLS